MIDRREFVKNLSIASAGLMLPALNACAQSQNKVWSFGKQLSWTNGVPPLFCLAYIDPGIKVQQGQEQQVAKYPIALVPQDSRRHHKAWRDRIKNINPDIKMLAYQMVIEETTVPGPGHDVLRSLKDSWVKYPGGFKPTVTYKTAVNQRQFSIYDPRIAEWQEGFIKACDAVFSDYPYDGLFLDQCTIYGKAAINPMTRKDMFDALQEVILILREKYPHKIIVGNSRYSWQGLNGEMNESRPKDIVKESQPFTGHVTPRYELFHHYMKDHSQVDTAKAMMRLAIENNMYFGAGINAQTVRWYDFMDEVLAEYQTSAPNPADDLKIKISL